MAGLAAADRPVGSLALVTGADPHQGRLADNAQVGCGEAVLQAAQQVAHANAADFLIEGQRQLQGAPERLPGGRHHGGDGAGHEAFHVGCAASVDAAIPVRCLKRG
ncbi:hypothetical protein D3C72_1484770 [compost metagenome]